MIEIVIEGKSYPCRESMGAWLLFKERTGREVTQIAPGAISDMFTLLWCCVVTASRRDGVEFGYTLEDFGDNVTPEVLQAWIAHGRESGEDDTAEENREETSKKK